MTTTSPEATLLADRVSDQTIRRLEFLLGGPDPDFRNSTIVMIIGGDRYELRIDSEGGVTVRTSNTGEEEYQPGA